MSLNAARRISGWLANHKHFVSLVLILVGISVYFYIRQTGSVESQITGAVRGVPGDGWADLVLGKNDFNQAVPNQVVAWKLMNPGGTVVDRNVRPNRLYVYDGANSRILGHASLGACESDSNLACTANSDCPPGPATISNVAPIAQASCSSEYSSGWCYKVKDYIYGQCNNGEWATAGQPTGFVKLTWSQLQKISKIVLFDRACPEQVLSGHIVFSDGSENINFNALEGSGTIGTELTFNERTVTWIEVWIDQSQGTNVGISEIQVYGFVEEPVQKCLIQEGKSADIVLGQPDKENYSGCNNDGNMELFPYRKPASAETMCSNSETTVSPLESGTFAGMAVDSKSNLYVPDMLNNRILLFNDPFGTGAIADEVWGQKDFSGNRCNFTDDDLGLPGVPSPTADSLCLAAGSATAGVDIDGEGNLWVADSNNNRVLRFPKQPDGTISKISNLVFGQQYFTSRDWGNDSTHMNEPATVQVDKTTGWVYVADKKNHRIIIFKPPFANGMAYSELFGSGFSWPEGMMLDPNDEGLWVSSNGNHMLELWDLANTQTQPKKILFKDTYQPNGQCGTTTSNSVCTTTHTSGCLSVMCDVRGSFGIDSDGNLLIASSNFNQDVYRFPAPIPVPTLGVVFSATNRLFYPPDGKNLQTASSIWNAQDVLIANGQLIVTDGIRILFWNNPDSLTNGQAADGVAGVSSFAGKAEPGFGGMTVDNDNHLFVTRGGRIDIFDLPLMFGEMPSRTLFDSNSLVPVLGGGVVDWAYDDTITGLSYDKVGNYLWFSHPQPKMSRVYRVRDVLTNPVIDVVLGQADLKTAYCNRDPNDNPAVPKNAKPNTVCRPQNVVVDRVGNIWVSDHSLENEGNRRILMFKADKFQNITTNALFGPNADVISPETSTWKMGFDSQNRMAVGHNGYSGEPYRYFVNLYANPQETLKTTTAPDIMLRDFFSHAFSAYFDNNDNLYVVDLNRGRLLKFLRPFDAPFASPSPSPTVVPSPQLSTFTAIATEDGYVTESGENTNIGGSIDASGSTFRVGDTSSDKQYRSIMSFDTSALADNAQIVGATLKIKRSSVSGTDPFTTHGNLVIDGISGTFGNASLEKQDFETSPTHASIATFSPVTANGQVSQGEVNAANLSVVNPFGKTQFKFYFTLDDNDDGGSDHVRFYSGNTSTTSNRPVLEVEWTQGSPLPTPTPSPAPTPSPSIGPSPSPAPSPGGTTVTFTSIATEDGRVVESGENTNVGGSINNGDGTFRAGDNSSDKQFKSILSFDTSSLPDTATITSVKVKMRRNGLTGTDPFTTHGNLAMDIIKGTFGGAALESGDFQTPANASDVATFTHPTANGQWAEATVPSWAFSIVNLTGKTQVRAYFTLDDNDDVSDDYISFASGNHSTTSYRPVLEVVYQ